MTDVELSSLLSDLRMSADRLNSETSGVNTIISSVESQLVTMNIGLECWLEQHDNDIIEIRMLSKDSRAETQIGFAKVGEWSLAIREARYDYDKQQDEWVQVGEPIIGKLQDASRDTRIKALKMLPKLLALLKERAEEDARTITAAKKLLGW